MVTNVKVNFMHPTDGRIQTVTLDSTMTAQEAISELISSNFIPPFREGQTYELSIKGGAILQPNQTMADAGIKDGDTLRVNPTIVAGT